MATRRAPADRHAQLTAAAALLAGHLVPEARAILRAAGDEAAALAEIDADPLALRARVLRLRDSA